MDIMDHWIEWTYRLWTDGRIYKLHFTIQFIEVHEDVTNEIIWC